jgi:sulfotransferase
VFRFDTNTTVYSRIEALTDPRGLVGFAFQATKDAFYGQYAPGHLLLLTYESLVRNPSAAMRAVYQFIGEPWFEHDFDNVAFSADEFDARVGMPGLHSVRPKVEPIERTSDPAARNLCALHQRVVLDGSEEQRQSGADHLGAASGHRTRY